MYVLSRTLSTIINQIRQLSKDLALYVGFISFNLRSWYKLWPKISPPLRKYTTLSAGDPWASSNYRSAGSHSGHYSRRSLRVFPSLILCFTSSLHYLLLDYVKQSLSTFVMVDWSEGQLTPAGKATRLFGGTSKRSLSWRSRRKRFLLLRKLKRCPRKGTARSGNQHALTSQFIDFMSTTTIFFWRGE